MSKAGLAGVRIGRPVARPETFGGMAEFGHDDLQQRLAVLA
jgi:hypothetical protein